MPGWADMALELLNPCEPCCLPGSDSIPSIRTGTISRQVAPRNAVALLRFVGGVDMTERLNKPRVYIVLQRVDALLPFSTVLR